MKPKTSESPWKSKKRKNLKKPLVAEQPLNVPAHDLPGFRRHVEQIPAATLKTIMEEAKQNQIIKEEKKNRGRLRKNSKNYEENNPIKEETKTASIWACTNQPAPVLAMLRDSLQPKRDLFQQKPYWKNIAVGFCSNRARYWKKTRGLQQKRRKFVQNHGRVWEKTRSGWKEHQA